MKKIILFLFLLAFVHNAFSQKVEQGDPSKNAGKVLWQWSVEMGTLKHDVPADAFFPIKNISKDTITITNTWSGCGCTTPEPPGAKIAPGETHLLKAIYNANKVGDFYKVISVTTNLDPETQVVLALKGTVVE
jgi:Protein of unknown function (DUF1573)